MHKEILSAIFAYKYDGDYLENYRQLISAIKRVNINLDTYALNDIAIHLALESKSHRLGMWHSKKFEMATDLFMEIKNEIDQLIRKLPKYIQNPLLFMNEEIPMYRSQLAKNPYDQWILIAQPWEFYILETKNSSRLFINDFENSLNTEIELDEYIDWRIKNDDPFTWMLIYTKINAWRLQNWMKNIAS